jgi:biopolymer transport protein ExbD
MPAGTCDATLVSIRIRLRLVNTPSVAPFAALLLIVSALAGSTPVSRGFRLRLAKLERCGFDDRRIVVLQALEGGKYRINVEDVTIGELAGKLETIFRTRAERVVFVTAEADVPFSRVAELIDVAATQIDNIALLPSLETLSRPRKEPLCAGLVWRP